MPRGVRSGVSRNELKKEAQRLVQEHNAGRLSDEDYASAMGEICDAGFTPEQLRLPPKDLPDFRLGDRFVLFPKL